MFSHPLLCVVSPLGCLAVRSAQFRRNVLAQFRQLLSPFDPDVLKCCRAVFVPQLLAFRAPRLPHRCSHPVITIAKRLPDCDESLQQGVTARTKIVRICAWPDEASIQSDCSERPADFCHAMALRPT